MCSAAEGEGRAGLNNEFKKADRCGDRRDKNPDCTQEAVGVTAGAAAARPAQTRRGKKKEEKKRKKHVTASGASPNEAPLSSARLTLKQTAVGGGDYFRGARPSEAKLIPADIPPIADTKALVFICHRRRRNLNCAVQTRELDCRRRQVIRKRRGQPFSSRRSKIY